MNIVFRSSVTLIEITTHSEGRESTSFWSTLRKPEEVYLSRTADQYLRKGASSNALCGDLVSELDPTPEGEGETFWCFIRGGDGC